MHQQPYCLTLPKPFFKIFLFRIYAPTTHSTDIEFDETSVSGFHTSPRQSSPHKPIHQRHCPHTPQTPQIPQPYTTTNSTHAPVQPPQTPQIPQPYTTTNSTHAPVQPPQTPTTIQPHTHTLHKHPHPYSLHRHPQPHKHTHDAGPPTDADVDAVAPTLTPTRRRCCSTDLVAIGQARYRIRPHKNRQYQSTPAIGQARYRIRLDRPDRIRPKPDQAGLDKVRPDRTRPGIRQAGYSTKIRPYQTSRNQAGRVQNRIRT